MTRVITSSGEAKELVDQPLGESGPLVIDQDRVNRFAAATEDHQWIHVDVERAASGPFGGTIAHGYMTLSLVPYFAAQIYTLDFGNARLNYGSDKVRFPTPVPVGSTVRATASFVLVRTEPQGTYVTTRFTISVDGSTKPACVAETTTLVVGESAT